jgi:hypothetical protein
MTEPFETYDEQTDYDWDYDAEDRGPRPKILWGRVISLVIFVLIGFLIGRWSNSGGPSQAAFDDLTAENTRLETVNDDLQRDLTETEAALDNQQNSGGNNTGGADEPDTTDEEEGDGSSAAEDLEPDVATVQSGDTLNEIIEAHYGCTTATSAEDESVNLTANVIDTNEAAEEDVDFQPNKLAAGQDILLPPLPTGYEC